MCWVRKENNTTIGFPTLICKHVLNIFYNWPFYTWLKDRVQLFIHSTRTLFRKYCVAMKNRCIAAWNWSQRASNPLIDQLFMSLVYSNYLLQVYVCFQAEQCDSNLLMTMPLLSNSINYLHIGRKLHLYR